MHTQPNITSFNAQDLNGREIASRFNEDLFEIYFLNTLDINIDAKLLKKNIKIINILAKNKFLNISFCISMMFLFILEYLSQIVCF